MPVAVRIHNQTSRSVDGALCQRIVPLVLEQEGRQASSVNLVFMEDDALRRMKRKYFHRDQFTDVIAFNLNDPGDDELEGELYLAPAFIASNASRYRVSFMDELARVLIHGTLHLCGHEDDTDDRRQAMREREDHYLKLLGKHLLQDK